MKPLHTESNLRDTLIASLLNVEKIGALCSRTT